MKDEINETNDLTILGLDCYICGEIGHLSVDCPKFENQRGNLRNHTFEKLKKQYKKRMTDNNYSIKLMRNSKDTIPDDTAEKQEA